MFCKLEIFEKTFIVVAYVVIVVHEELLPKYINIFASI